jgi:hypothetical protein
MCSGAKPERVPKEVSYYYLCVKFKCLPGAGGLLDQDPALVEAFILCMNTEGKYQEYKEKQDEAKRKQEERRKKMQQGGQE